MLKKIKLLQEAWYHAFEWTPHFQQEAAGSVQQPISFEALVTSLSHHLTAHQFKKEENSSFSQEGIVRLQVWKKKNFNMNRAVVLLELAADFDVNQLTSFVKELKFKLGKQIGYFPFLYELGLQVVVLGQQIPLAGLTSPIDKINNFRVLVQSIFVLDQATHHYYKSITWGQTVSAKFQQSIDAGIQELFNSN